MFLYKFYCGLSLNTIFFILWKLDLQLPKHTPEDQGAGCSQAQDCGENGTLQFRQVVRNAHTLEVRNSKTRCGSMWHSLQGIIVKTWRLFNLPLEPRLPPHRSINWGIRNWCKSWTWISKDWRSHTTTIEVWPLHLCACSIEQWLLYNTSCSKILAGRTLGRKGSMGTHSIEKPSYKAPDWFRGEDTQSLLCETARPASMARAVSRAARWKLSAPLPKTTADKASELQKSQRSSDKSQESDPRDTRMDSTKNLKSHTLVCLHADRIS